jgi:hypothetical protein
MSDFETRIALLERAVDEAKHRARQDRQIAMLLEAELQITRRELVALRAKINAVGAVALGIGPLFAWLLELLR